MPRHSGGGARSGNRASGGNTRRQRTRKNTYGPKQHHASPYWKPFQEWTAAPAIAPEPRHRDVAPLGRPMVSRRGRRTRRGRS